MQEELPKTIGKYKIHSVLGIGAMGTVYKAEDPEIGRMVAVKVIKFVPSNPYMDEKSCLERFRVEARSAGNLRHPNIVTIFDVNTESNPPYLVMDYIEGVGLDKIIEQKGRLDAYDAVFYLYQIAQGMDYAHQKGIIHRDIKPSNVLIDQNGNAYVLDFGVATITGHSHYDESSPIMGSPAYMAPEQILNEEVDNRADIFSLAVVAFECFTGRRPFEGEDFTIVARNILQGSRRTVEEYQETLPLALESEFERALSTERHTRFRSAATMIMVFCDALGIKNPLGGTSTMRGYTYVTGGDSVSDVFRELAQKIDKPTESPKISEAVRKNFGTVKPVTPQHEFWTSMKILMGVVLLLVGFLTLYLVFFQPAIFG